MGPPTKALHHHSRLRFIQNAKIYQIGFYKILLTFHCLSFHTPPKTCPFATVLHSQSPGPPPEETQCTKQPYSNSPFFHLSCAWVDSTRSIQVKTARGHTIINTPSYPGHGLGSRKTGSVRSWGHKAQINRDERYIWSLSQIFGLQTGSSFIQHGRQSLHHIAIHGLFWPQVITQRSRFIV